MAKQKEVQKEEKKDVCWWILYSEKNARDTNTFIATEFEVLDNGFVKATGSFRRRKAVTTLLIEKTGIISIEEEAIKQEEETEEKA